MLDGVVLASNAAISGAIRDVYSETRTILEPAGALAVAGARAYIERHGLKVELRKQTQLKHATLPAPSSAAVRTAFCRDRSARLSARQLLAGRRWLPGSGMASLRWCRHASTAGAQVVQHVLPPLQDREIVVFAELPHGAAKAAPT